MIEPTNGRIVLFTPARFDPLGNSDRARIAREITQVYGGGPWAAVIVHVWSPRCVNLVVFRPDGAIECETSVILLQDDDPPREHGRCAAWPKVDGQSHTETAARITSLEQAMWPTEAQADYVA